MISITIRIFENGKPTDIVVAAEVTVWSPSLLDVSQNKYNFLRYLPAFVLDVNRVGAYEILLVHHIEYIIYYKILNKLPHSPWY